MNDFDVLLYFSEYDAVAGVFYRQFPDFAQQENTASAAFGDNDFSGICSKMSIFHSQSLSKIYTLKIGQVNLKVRIRYNSLSHSCHIHGIETILILICHRPVQGYLHSFALRCVHAESLWPEG